MVDLKLVGFLKKSLVFNFSVEISRGGVYMKYNAKNCYGENTNWDDILGNPEEQHADIEIISMACSPVSGLQLYNRMSAI